MFCSACWAKQVFCPGFALWDMSPFTLHLSLNRQGLWGTTDDFTSSFLQFSLFSTAHGSYSSLQLFCEGPWVTSLQEDRCDEGAHQSYLGTERGAPLVPNWFQACQCCCHLCYPGEYLRLGTIFITTESKYLKRVTVSSFCPLTPISSPCCCLWCCCLLGTDLHETCTRTKLPYGWSPSRHSWLRLLPEPNNLTLPLPISNLAYIK